MTKTNEVEFENYMYLKKFKLLRFVRRITITIFNGCKLF